MFDNHPFASIFTLILGCFIAAFFALYHLTVPVINANQLENEERSGITILSSVYELIDNESRNLDRWKNDFIELKKTELSDITDITFGYINYNKDKIINNPEFRKNLLENLRHLTYSRSGYTWIMDFSGFVLSHPDPGFNNADQSTLTDARGNLIAAPLIDKALKNGSGFHRYWWSRLNEKEASEKLTYCRLHKEMSWIVCTGLYIDDVEKEMVQKKQELIRLLRDHLSQVKIGSQGYVYIFSGEHEMIIHPDPSLEGKDTRDIFSPSLKVPLGQALINASKTDGRLIYTWSKETDPNNFTYEKISWVRHFPKYNWYVATSAYMDDLNKSGDLLSTRISFIIIPGFFLASIFAYINLLHKSKRETELQASYERSSNRAKSDFLAQMSHEIRTPLNGVIGTIDLLTDTKLTSSQKNLTTIISNSGDNLLHVINDILDFSKIDSGKIDIEFIEFDLQLLIHETVQMFSIQHKNTAINFTASIPLSDCHQVIGDPHRIKQVIINLLSNAFKFTEQGTIALECHSIYEDDDSIEYQLTVSDTGIGITADNQAAIFDPFDQADKSTSRIYGGTGLGLAICKRIIEQMNGRIGVDSQSDKGSSFWFTLSLNKAKEIKPSSNFGNFQILIIDKHHDISSNILLQLEKISGGLQQEELFNDELIHPESKQLLVLVKPTKNELTRIVNTLNTNHPSNLPTLRVFSNKISSNLESIINNYHGIHHLDLWPTLDTMVIRYLGNNHELAENSDQSPSATFTKPLHVLVAEDNATNQFVINNMLNKLHIHADIVSNGEQAITAIQGNNGGYDLILMDCEMPIMDGFQATEKIRHWESSNYIPATPIIALTAHAVTEYREKTIQSGMNHCLVKPCKMSELQTVIEELTTKPTKGS